MVDALPIEDLQARLTIVVSDIDRFRAGDKEVLERLRGELVGLEWSARVQLSIASPSKVGCSKCRFTPTGCSKCRPR